MCGSISGTTSLDSVWFFSLFFCRGPPTSDQRSMVPNDGFSSRAKGYEAI